MSPSLPPCPLNSSQFCGRLHFLTLVPLPLLFPLPGIKTFLFLFAHLLRGWKIFLDPGLGVSSSITVLHDCFYCCVFGHFTIFCLYCEVPEGKCTFFFFNNLSPLRRSLGMHICIGFCVCVFWFCLYFSYY